MYDAAFDGFVTLRVTGAGGKALASARVIINLEKSISQGNEVPCEIGEEGYSILVGEDGIFNNSCTPTKLPDEDKPGVVIITDDEEGPSKSPELSNEPEYTTTPKPTRTAKATKSPKISKSPKRSKHPLPSKSPKRSKHPKPSKSPKRPKSPKRSKHPLPSKSPKRSKHPKPAKTSKNLQTFLTF